MGTVRLVAINFGGIGDEILFLPALASIRAAHRHWHLTLVLEPRSASVRQITDLIDETIEFDIKKRPLHTSDLCHLLSLLREGAFDVAISSGSSPLVSVLLFLSGIPTRVGYDSGGLARLLLTAAVPLVRDQYAGFMYHDLVRGLGIAGQPRLPEASVGAESLERMRRLLAEGPATAGGAEGGRARRVLIHPGTSRLALEKGIVKTWSADAWASLVAMLAGAPGILPVLAGGPDDRQTVSEIACRCAGLRLLQAAGRTASLADLAALISLCDLIVCVDSAPMHLAVALGKPLVALFGPTDERRLLPADPRFLALRAGQTPGEALSRPSRPAPGVRVPPETVYQAVLDQLRRG